MLCLAGCNAHNTKAVIVSRMELWLVHSSFLNHLYALVHLFFFSSDVLFLSSTLCNRSFSICIVCTVMSRSAIGLGIVLGVPKLQINKPSLVNQHAELSVPPRLRVLHCVM